MFISGASCSHPPYFSTFQQQAHNTYRQARTSAPGVLSVGQQLSPYFTHQGMKPHSSETRKLWPQEHMPKAASAKGQGSAGKAGAIPWARWHGNRSKGTDRNTRGEGAMPALYPTKRLPGTSSLYSYGEDDACLHSCFCPG